MNDQHLAVMFKEIRELRLLEKKLYTILSEIEKDSASLFSLGDRAIGLGLVIYTDFIKGKGLFLDLLEKVKSVVLQRKEELIKEIIAAGLPVLGQEKETSKWELVRIIQGEKLSKYLNNLENIGDNHVFVQERFYVEMGTGSPARIYFKEFGWEMIQ
ncbi:MAG: hypothetical protein WCT18_00620 [Patescibacteria group bacterium]